MCSVTPPPPTYVPLPLLHCQRAAVSEIVIIVHQQTPRTSHSPPSTCVQRCALLWYRACSILFSSTKMHPSSFCVPLRYVQSSPPAWINSSSNSHPLCLALYPETHANCLRATSVLPIFPVPPCILCTLPTTLTATCLWRPKWLRSRQQWTNTTQNTRLPSPKQSYCKRAFGSSSILNQRVTADACPAVLIHRNYTLGVSAIHLFLRRAHLLCVMQIATKHDHATLHARRNCLSTLLELSYSHHLPHRFIMDYALLTPMPLVLECRQPASRLISATAVVMRSPAKHYGHRKRTRLKPLATSRQRRRTSSHTCLSHRRKTHKTVQRCSQMLNHHHPPRPTAITAPPTARPNQTHFLNQHVYPAQAANSNAPPDTQRSNNTDSSSSPCTESITIL